MMRLGYYFLAKRLRSYIPPMKGKKHVHALLETLFTVKPVKRKTNISAALDYVAQLKKKNMILFLLSDFIDDDFKKSLAFFSPPT